MAAESALFLTHGCDGIVCIGDAYGGMLELLSDQLPLLSIQTHFILGHELDRLDALLASATKLVFSRRRPNRLSTCFMFGQLPLAWLTRCGCSRWLLNDL